MTKRERMPRTSLPEGAWLDAHLDVGADPRGNRAQRRKAANQRRKEPTMTDTEPTPEAPAYRMQAQDDGGATVRWMIVCDEGWRTSIVCEDMYEWAASWLLDVLGRRPYAPGNPS